MNVFSYILARGSLDSSPDLHSTKFVVDDNIGESIHIHYRNLRLEMTVDDFDTLAKNVTQAAEQLEADTE